MLFSWLRKRRRRKLLAEPFPQGWLQILHDDVGHYRLLPEHLQRKLRDTLRILVAEMDWEGVGGLEITDRVRVTIAAVASLLLLGQENFYFENVQSVLVTPAGYKSRRRYPLAGGAEIVATEELEGEADYNGPIKIAWPIALSAAHEPGYGENLVLHEFAHKIDMLSGTIDGTPPMPTKLLERWEPIMKEGYEELMQSVEWDRETFLDPYGATDEAEFFAVVTEAFFDDPRGLKEHHPELYQLFSDFYCLDPAEWFEGR